MTVTEINTFSDILTAFMVRNEFEVCFWDDVHKEITGYNRKSSPPYHPEYADGSLEPFCQSEYIAGSTTDLDWEDTTRKMGASKTLIVAISNELLAQWQKEWEPHYPAAPSS